ncbi:MAG: MFS transporter, partial [Gammaproteobacteria bacterium]
MNQEAQPTQDSNAEVPPERLKLVVTASTAGTTFEWYDFFLGVPLAGIIAKLFFAGLGDTVGYLFALLSFAAGFAFRPLGALVFGRMGDRLGRKATFLITTCLMGGATFAIGLLPTVQTIGLWAPALFVFLRILQGMALGGEWGGAAIYIAEHSPHGRRGELTSWLGPAASIGLAAAMVVTLAVRLATGEEAFAEWGWRIPFLLSGVLFAASLWIRLRLQESPVFAALQEGGRRSAAPISEAFGRWSNLRIAVVALFGIMIAQGAIWFTAFFYTQSFMERMLKAPPKEVDTLMLVALLISVPLYLFFGWLSDRVGRKPVMLSGIVLAVFGIFPVFDGLRTAVHLALAEAVTASPVVLQPDA